MTDEEKYAAIDTIVGSTRQYTGEFLREHCEALEAGRTTHREFARHMRTGDIAFAAAIEQLRQIRFNRMGQRRALTKLISGLQSYRNGITALVWATKANDEALLRRAEKHFERAIKEAAAFTKFTWNNRGR